MRGVVLHFVILFSVLCAGLHAPALAHGHHDEHDEASFLMADTHHAGAHEDFSDDSSSDLSQELFHHHHCPMAMTSECSGGSDAAVAKGDMLRPGEATALVSRASAPPIEPPLA